MRVVKWLDKHFEESVLVFLLLLIAFVMLAQVIMRQIFNSSFTWPEEFCRYCYVWTGFFSLGYTVRQGNILRVAVVMDLLPETLRKIIAIAVNLVCLVFFAVFFHGSIGVVQGIAKMKQLSPAMRWPMDVVYWCTVLGFGLAAIRTVQVLHRQITRFNERQMTTSESIRAEAKAEAALAEADLATNR